MITNKKQTGIRITQSLSDKLTEFSNSKGISKNAVIIMAIDEFLKKHEEISKQDNRGDQDE
ncbi:hypothetical protein ACLUX0_00410 [Limosilactobacillus mucosae]